MTIAEWFSEHPEALEAADAWARARRDGSGSGGRTFVRVLREEFSYPFKNHSALTDWARRHLEVFQGGTPEEPAKAPLPVTFHKSDADVRSLERREDFLITSAVSNAAANLPFLAACERWKAETQGIISINPVRYRNPKTREEATQTQADEWWAPELEPYMLESEIRPHEYLSLMPTKMQATVSNPLPPRMSSLTMHRSAVFGHPQLCMRTVPTPQAELPKILYSSGAITEKWYSDTLAGTLGDFHHSYSAVLAEIRGKKFHLREVVWDGKRFIDLDRSYAESGISDAPPPEALVMGDIHVGLEDPDVMEATFGEDGIVPSLRPRRLLLHDLYNGTAVNPHEFGKRLTRAALGKGRDLDREIRMNADWLNALPGFEEIVVVWSNHDDFLMRWLQGGEKNVEPQNQKLYHKLCYEILEEHDHTGKMPLALELALRPHLKRGVRFLQIDEPYRAGSIELGMHGHLGPDGARGTIRNLAQIGTKSMIAHKHGPGIWQGVHQVGLSAKYRHGYNRGPSSWLHTHGLVHANFRRQLLHMIGKDYRG